MLHYLPACSPDLYPIEMAFSKMKAHLRQAAPRTLPKLIKAAAAALQLLPPSIAGTFSVMLPVRQTNSKVL